MSKAKVTSRYQARHVLIEQVAPRYQQATFAEKTFILDMFLKMTGYSRKYAISLLNHIPERAYTIKRPRLPHYSSEIHQALIFAWNAANQICAKRLIPFLPTLIAALERHNHLHLMPEVRSQLLSMSASTADRVLRSHRLSGSHDLSTTKTGLLLKDQIPIHTFQDWDDFQPGFLEVDLVAHCGPSLVGGFLSTFTVTDVATGWTECLPLLNRRPETILDAIQKIRLTLPFPLLGLDCDR